MSNPTAELFATSVDDLQSSLGCALANIKPENIEGDIRYYGSALNSNPDGGKTKRQVIERHIRALEKLRHAAPAAETQAPSEDATPFDPDLYTLLNFPPSTGKFKDALQDALLEVVTEAFDAAFHAGQKTRFNALRGELKRRYDDSGMDSHNLPTWEEMKKQEDDRKIKEGIDAQVAERAAAGDVQAMAYCRQNGIPFSRSERHNDAGLKDCAEGGAPLPQALPGPGDATAAAGGDAPVGAGSDVAVRPLTLEALEVLPPVRRPVAPGHPMPLPEIEDHIRGFTAKIEDRTRGYHNEVIYDIVGKGLMLLKGRAAHLAQASTKFQAGNKKAAKNGVETVSTPSDSSLVKIEENGEKGFLGWLGAKFPDQSSRTARNYMNAARNAGLTSDHSLEDVEALRIAMALHERKPTEMYRLADKEAPATLPPAPAVNLVAEVQRDLFGILDQVLQVRDDDNMLPEVFEACTQRIKATLEKFTGARWVMAQAVDDSAEHGDMDQVADNLNTKSAKDAKKKGVKIKQVLSAGQRANKKARNVAAVKARWAKCNEGGKGV